MDKDNVYLLGFSQGGVVSAIAAAENPDKVKGVILMNAAFVLFDDAKALFKSADEIPEYVNFRGNRLGKIYFERSISYDIYQIIPSFAKDVLIIQGDKDNIVPLRYAQRAKEAYPKAELHTVAGGGHLFTASQNRTLLPIISNYLKK